MRLVEVGVDFQICLTLTYSSVQKVFAALGQYKQIFTQRICVETVE